MLCNKLFRLLQQALPLVAASSSLVAASSSLVAASPSLVAARERACCRAQMRRPINVKLNEEAG